MADATPPGEPTATIVVSRAPRRLERFELRLAAGATVADAMRECALLQEAALIEAGRLGVAIWGRRVRLSQRLEPGDRIEVCRPLVVDPKAARRKRFERQGRRASGLFAADRVIRP